MLLMETKLRLTIGKRLKELREESKMSQSDLASELNVSQAAVAQYENGKNAPDEEKLFFIAKRFNCSLDYLFGLSNVKRIAVTASTDINRNELKQEIVNEVLMSLMGANKITIEHEVREMGSDIDDKK